MTAVAGHAAPPKVRLSSGILAVLLALGLFCVAAERQWGGDASIVPYLGAAVVFAGMVPGLARRSRRLSGKPRPLVPYLPMMGIAYAVYYGLPALLLDESSGMTDNVAATSVRDALMLALIGFVSLWVGYAVVGTALPGPAPLRLSLCPVRSRRLAAVLLVVGLLVTLLVGRGGSQLVELIRRLGELGFGVLLLLALRRQLPGPWRTLLGVALPAYMFLQIGTGSLAQLMLPCAFLAMITWGVRRRVPVALMVVLALVVVLLRGNVDAFRGETWQGGGTEEPASIEKSDRFVRMLGEQFGSGEASFLESATQVLARVNFCVLFALVVERTPESVPYWDGGSYATLLPSLVPRLIWPDKPRKNLGQEFGHRYRILAPDDETTSINLPQLVELYANFGRAGVVLGMLLIGLLYRALDRWLNAPTAGDGMVLVAATIFSRLLNIESDFSLAHGALPYHIALFYLMLWLARRRQPSGAALAPLLAARHGPGRA